MYSKSQFIYSQTSGPKGLWNLGASCYINATVQCLKSVKDLKAIMTGRCAGPVSTAFLDVLNALEGQGEAEDISDFHDTVAKHWVHFQHGTEMDVEEFLTFLFPVLHAEMQTDINDILLPSTPDLIENVVSAWRSANSSVISELFFVQICTLAVCCNCPYMSGQYSDINSHLSLPLSASLEGCLQEFTKEEYQSEATCSQCFKEGMKHRLILGRLPPILVIQLKRFRRHFDGSYVKISEGVSIPGSIDLDPYTVDLIQSNTSYNLLAVTNHHGKFMHKGHYTALCRRGERFYRFNDSQVSGTTSRKLDCDSAYVLWYQLEKKQITGDLPLDNCTYFENIKIGNNLLHEPSEVDISEENTASSPSNNDNMWDNGVDSEVDMFEEYIGGNEGDAGDKSEVDISNEDYECQKFVKSIDNLSLHHPDPPVSGDGSAATQQQHCNHPVLDLDIIDPQLTEDDVPGAKINIKDLDNCLKDDYVRWLHCRRLKKIGNKAELKARIENHIRNGKELKIYQGVDEGKWYELKRERLIKEAEKSIKNHVPMMPMGLKVFQPFPSVHIPNKYSSAKARDYLDLIPEVRFSYVGGVECLRTDEEDDKESEEVLVDFSQPTQVERKNMFVDGTLKRANNFIDSGRVLRISDCVRNNHYFVKADVRASYKDRQYNIYIMISKSTGDVCYCSCNCKARALGRCCHIFAVLLLIGRHVQSQGHEAVTCTGKLCYWVAPANSTTNNPGVVKEKNEYSKNSANYHRRAYFDPRPTAHQLDSDESSVAALQKVLDSMPGKLLWHFQLLERRPIVEESYPDVEATYEIAERCSKFFWELNSVRNVSTSQPLHFTRTSQQSSSDFWFKERGKRITASIAKDVLGLSFDHSRRAFLRKHVWGLDSFQTAAMQRGSNLEETARREYRNHLKTNDVDIEVLECGMWVHPTFPQLSCSPDGLIVDTNGIKRLLEIKCPAVLQEMDPNDFEKLPKAQLGRFCLKRNKTTKLIELKTTHKFYYQVQMSLDIMNLDFCDFLVFSTVKNGDVQEPKFLIVNVKYDAEFWREKRIRLINIHREWIVPEHFLKNTVAHKVPCRLIYPAFHEEHDDDYFLSSPEADTFLEVESESEFLVNYGIGDRKPILKK